MTIESKSVLHFLWSGEIGGAERSVYQLVREQLRRGMRIGVLFGEDASGFYGRSLADIGCHVLSLHASSGADVTVLPSAIRAIRHFDIHHFHAVEPLTFLASLLSGRKARVFTQRGGIREPDSTRLRIRRMIAKQFVLRSLHAWSANTAHAKESMTKHFGVSSQNIDVVPNGIDFDLLQPRDSRSGVRKGLGMSQDAFVIGTTAVMKPWKRLHLLLEATSRLDPERLAVVMVGDGPDRSRLQGLARTLGIDDLVVFTGMREQVSDLVAAMDAFVLPSSKRESFGNSVVEAMALGVPSIVFADSPGIRAHIEPGRTGFVVNDVTELVQVLNRMRGDPLLRERMGNAAAQHVRSAYGIGRMADGYNLAYRKALSRSGVA